MNKCYGWDFNHPRTAEQYSSNCEKRRIMKSKRTDKILGLLFAFSFGFFTATVLIWIMGIILVGG